MAHLRQNTFRLTGMDYSQNLLDIAHRQLGPSARLVRGDMRALPFDCVFDALTNFFTSFGYFLPEQENCRVLAEIARVLRPGGRFLLDYMNEKQVRASLRPYTERSQEGLVIIEERWIDDCSHRVNKKISVKQGTQTIHEGFESVRLYAPEELLALLRHNGLEIQEVFGNYDGAAFEPDQPRMIVVGSKDTDAQPA